MYYSFTKKEYPVIDLGRLAQVLTAEEFEIVKGIVSTRGENKGRLRASKPEVERIKVKDPDSYTGYDYQPVGIQGETAYVWRMVAFFASPDPKHHCMPCTADFDLPGKFAESRELAKRMDKLVDKVLDTISPEKWHGVRRWGQAFGQIGTPVLTPEGAYVYR